MDDRFNDQSIARGNKPYPLAVMEMRYNGRLFYTHGRPEREVPLSNPPQSPFRKGGGEEKGEEKETEAGDGV